jgi:O-antigen biosynthesis protein
LARVRARWYGPLLGWMLFLKRKLVPLKPHPLEASLPACETIEAPAGPVTGRVSVIIPLRDRVDLLRGCLRSLRRTGRDDIEYVLIDNGSREPATHRVLDRLRQRRGVKVLTWPGAFNFSALCNAGARQATGEYLLFLNNDTEVLTADWRERMVGLAARPDVGVVGALLLYPDQTIQHAGLFADAQGRWVHAGRGRPAAELRGVSVVPGVTGACLMVRRDLFAELGGFDETLPLTYSDVDLCRKAQQRGLKCVVTPHARFLHYEGLTRGFAGDEPGAEHLEAMAAFPAKG